MSPWEHPKGSKDFRPARTNCADVTRMAADRGRAGPQRLAHQNSIKNPERTMTRHLRQGKTFTM